MIDFWKRDPVLEEVLEEEQRNGFVTQIGSGFGSDFASPTASCKLGWWDEDDRGGGRCQ